MNQDKKFIKARENAKRYIFFSRIFGGANCSTYIKLSGGVYNGVRNGLLSEMDYNNINSALNDSEKAINDLRVELNRIRKESINDRTKS